MFLQIVQVRQFFLPGLRFWNSETRASFANNLGRTCMNEFLERWTLACGMCQVQEQLSQNDFFKIKKNITELLPVPTHERI